LVIYVVKLPQRNVVLFDYYIMKKLEEKFGLKKLSRDEMKKVSGGGPPGCGVDYDHCGVGLPACCANLFCNTATGYCQVDSGGQ
jgi:hypothetical protein